MNFMKHQSLTGLGKKKEKHDKTMIFGWTMTLITDSIQIMNCSVSTDRKAVFIPLISLWLEGLWRKIVLRIVLRTGSRFFPAQTPCERSGCFPSVQHRDVFSLYNHINCLIVCRSGRLITQCFAKASRPIIYTQFSWQIKLGSEKVF